jgi:tetratricopeptide (TPR) repeat protein
MHDLNKALNDYTIALKLNPELDFLRVDRAEINLKLGDTNSAVNDLNYLSDYVATSNTYISKCAYLLYDIKHYDMAITNFTKALELNKFDGRLYFMRALCYSRTRNHIAAINDYLEYLRFSPYDADAYNNLAYGYLHEKEYELAEKYFNKALNLKSRQFDSYLGLAILKYQQKEYYESKNYILKAIKINRLLKKGIKGINQLEQEGYFWDPWEKRVISKIFEMMEY